MMCSSFLSSLGVCAFWCVELCRYRNCCTQDGSIDADMDQAKTRFFVNDVIIADRKETRHVYTRRSRHDTQQHAPNHRVMKAASYVSVSQAVCVSLSRDDYYYHDTLSQDSQCSVHTAKYL